MASGETKVVDEFNRLLEKSKQLFNGLRELPPHGHKHWQAYFGRTFDVYTKLWKFQQQYRQILDAKMGLKRWQIGEIASKIGQLYYHYYLRTSDTNYLFESFAFYAAIKQRQYYNDVEAERRADLVVKKLRYYARFIVVCLLLNRMKLLDELLIDFAAEIEKFSKSYGPDEQLEWSLVIEELRSFLRADRCIEVLDSSGHLVPLVHRLTPFSASTPANPPLQSKSSSHCPKSSQQHAQQNPFGTFHFPGVKQHLRLQEAVIVGASHNQPRFSELTIDAYRIAQAIERQPDDMMVGANSSRIYDSSPVPIRRHVGETSSSTQPMDNRVAASGAKRENPHKYLIYRPTFAQLFNCISAAHRDVSSNGVLLVYLSSDAAGGLPASPQTDPRPFSPGTWTMQESGHFGSLERPPPPPPLPRKPDIMLTSAVQMSQQSYDGEAGADHAGDYGHETRLSPVTLKHHHISDHHVDDGYGEASCEYSNIQHRREKSNRRTKSEISLSPTVLPNSIKDRNCLYPGDLYPFLRKPLLLIIDSENSSAFSRFPSLFDQPLVALLAPPRLPSSMNARRQESGGLFTLFLHSPLAAFCFICGIRSMPVALWDRCQATVHKFLLAACRLFLSAPPEEISQSYVAMFSDDFLRSLILRFVFCHYVMSCHATTCGPVLARSKSIEVDDKEEDDEFNALNTANYFPLSYPPLPQNLILKDGQLYKILADLSLSLSVIDKFPSLVTFSMSPTSHLACQTENTGSCHTYQNIGRQKEKSRERRRHRAQSATRGASVGILADSPTLVTPPPLAQTRHQQTSKSEKTK